MLLIILTVIQITSQQPQLNRKTISRCLQKVERPQINCSQLILAPTLLDINKNNIIIILLN